MTGRSRAELWELVDGLDALPSVEPSREEELERLMQLEGFDRDEAEDVLRLRELKGAA